MIRDSLAIVVVCRRHPDRVADTVASLAADSVPGKVIVANLSSKDVRFMGASVVTGRSTDSLSVAIDLALAETDAETLWILRDDIRVRPGSFAALASVLDTSPSVGIVGPKVMDADSPATIVELGESMTRSGFAVHLAERELDQAQYDRTSDVLAVGEAGMLVRRTVWTTLGGFDDALRRVDGALDFCVRARSAGWRVEVVPSAVIDATDTSLESIDGDVSESTVIRESARARAHRLLVYGNAALRPLIALSVIVGAAFRGIGQFVRKRPAPFAELRGSISGARNLSAIGKSHRAFIATRTGNATDSRLFVSTADLRHRRAVRRDDERAILEARDDEPRLRFGAIALWATGLAAVMGFILNGRFLGSAAIAGGASLPLPASWGESFAAIGATWSDVAGGFTGAPDGFASLMGIVGLATWWNPNAAMVFLFVCAIPLSFASGYVGAGVVTTHTRVAMMVGGVWALLPTLHVALADGRIPAVLAHLALPLFVRALAGSSIVSWGWASICGAIVWVSVPVLAPLVVGAVIIRALRGSPAVFAVVLPALAFEWPRLVASATSPLSYFADRGVPLPVIEPRGFESLALWPGKITLPFVSDDVALLFALAVVGVMLTLAIIAVVVADNARVGLLLAFAGLALGIWGLLGGVPLSTANGAAVSLFPGPLFDVVWFALVAGASVSVGALRRSSGPLVPIAVALVAATSVGPLFATWSGTARVVPSTVRTLPAYVEAETTTHPGGGTLILAPTENGLIVEIQRDSGVTLTDWTAAAATRATLGSNEQAIAELAANLIVESGFDVATAMRDAGIRFVLLEAKPTATEVSAIASHPGLTSVGATDRGILWRVNEPTETSATDRQPDMAYRVILGVTLLVAAIAAVPTSFPRRRASDDDLMTDEGDDDERS